MTPTTLSVSLMLIRGKLLQGHAIERNVAIVMPDADAAWARLMLDGECAMVADPDQLQQVRERYAGWVMEGQGVGVG